MASTASSPMLARRGAWRRYPIVIPGRCEASNPESRDSLMRNCASGFTLRVPGNDVGKLRPHDRGAGGGAAFEVDMRLAGVLQRVGVVDRHVQLAVDDGGKQGVGAFQTFGALADVVVVFRAGRQQSAVISGFGA